MWELNLFRKNVESKKEELLKKSFEKKSGPVWMWELNLFRKNVESKKEELLKKSFEKKSGPAGI